MEFHPSVLNLCLWVLFVLLQRHRCLGCADDERTALLEIKASARSPDYLSTWVDDKTSDYCSWKLIKCSNTTGCVSQLSLKNVFLPSFELTDKYTGDHTLFNASLFLPFKDLQHLDISYNDFRGWKSLQGIDKLAKLKKLHVLNLGGNHFSNSVLEPLSELTSLRTLILDQNYIGERSPSEISQGITKLSNLKKLEVLSLNDNNLNIKFLVPLGELTSLETLYLRGNHITEGSSPRGNYIVEGSSSEISQGFEKLLNLKRLRFLDLQENRLHNTSIFASLSKLTSLQYLNLGSNQLTMGSSIENSQGICELKKLWGLDLRFNYMKGEIPLCLANFTSLRILDLSDNDLTGNIPPSLTSNMRSLERLDFSRNHFTGSIPPSLLQNLTSLQHVSFSDNQFEGTSLITSMFDQNFQLKTLRLSNCNLNTSTKRLLKFLHHQKDLRAIDLSHNNIDGEFPVWLVTNNTQLEIIVLKNNSLSGDIHFPLHRHTNLDWFDISKNHIEGHLQTHLGQVLQGVRYLNLSHNYLEGSIPTSLGEIQFLEDLDLSNNKFTGEIPESISGRLLYSLILSNNRLHGQISLNFFDYFILRLDNNQFTGLIPRSNNTTGGFLSTLDVSQNNISGRIPSWVANLTEVSTLVMGDNSFHGSIPSELCNLAHLHFLDLSENELSGNMPSCLNLTSLSYMHLQGNKLSGPLPRAVLRSPNLVTLNLNHNNFFGSIPGWLGSLENLGILLLKGNRLSGFVPDELCRSSKLSIIDLSHNDLSGNIPPCLSIISLGQSGVYEGTPHDSEDSSYGTIPTADHTDPFGYDVKYFYAPGRYVRQDKVKFMTKGLSGLYQGGILNYFAAMDLSSNNFTGHIPPELGALTAIRALNLSHNQLTGSIPKTLSKLKQLERMDLSYNKLSGEIPSELIALNFLGTFVVAYNNLSGRLPNMNQQAESNFEGNPYLCGPPLLKQCTGAAAPTDSATDASLSDVFGVDPISFLASCSGAYIVSLLALVIVLYINPHWRRLWFDFIDACLSFMFPFWAEAFQRVSNPFT